MLRASLAALALSSSLAFAQVDAGSSLDSGAPQPSATTASDVEQLRRDFEQKLDASQREVRELREEMRARLATQPIAPSWQEDWVDDKRKLELVTFDGYFRARPDLFYKFDLNRGNDAAGYALFPRSPSLGDRTQAGVNMRFRIEPTLNVSEEIRVRAQIDALDNLIWGSTPDYAYSRNPSNGYWYDRNEFSIFSFSQTQQRSGINSLQDSIAVKRVWGEVSTPVGILRFGRMPSHWGLGMLYNDGSGIDNDWGDTVDRVSFTVEPLAGFYITPMVDLNISGLSSTRLQEGGQPFDLSLADNSTSYILAVQRRDTEQERTDRLNADQFVFNYGLHFTYRNQRFDSVDALSQPAFGSANSTEGTAGSTAISAFVPRKADLFIPDIWLKLERKEWRIELEGAAILGAMQGRALSTTATDANQGLYVYQFGAVLQGEYKLLRGDLEIGGEIGFASGDKAAGFGNAPRRRGHGPNGSTELGDTDGPQYRCDSGCSDDEITNFRFNRDYRMDMILYREILGGVTDSIYFKPKVKYRITQGFEAFVAGIYSRVLFAQSAPGSLYTDSGMNLGIELNGGLRYETEDGFFGQVQYGILFPLDAFTKKDGSTPNSNGLLGGTDLPRENAQAVRAVVGIRF